jgi:uncharacterized protein YcsI (UPF0317 family)
MAFMADKWNRSKYITDIIYCVVSMDLPIIIHIQHMMLQYNIPYYKTNLRKDCN